MLKTHSQRALAVAGALLLLAANSQSDTRPLSEDRGAVHLYQLLTKLKTTARIMQVTAHPDDEDGGMLTLESRGRGVSVLLFTLTRGEGGQNKFGAESADELGVLRTLELLEADKYYGVEQRFSHVVDFGFSKTPEETFSKWHGHDLALADLVRAIRMYRPDVLIARFSGTRRDGHAHHEASGILTQEAFRAAGDPKRFPEQLKEGLLPWQAEKLYVGNPPRNADLSVADADYTLRLNIGTYSPLLGMSYTQFGLEGLAHQTSQGTGGIRVPPGNRWTYYKMTDSTLARPSDVEKHEEDFLDGINTSLSGLAARLGGEQAKVPFLAGTLRQLEKHVAEASSAFSISDPSQSAPALLAGLDESDKLLRQIESCQLSPEAKAKIIPSLQTKVEQFRNAANEALGIAFEVSVDPPGPPPGPSFFPRMEQTITLATPGQTFSVSARLYNRGKGSITPGEMKLEAPDGWKTSPVQGRGTAAIQPGEVATQQFTVSVPENANYTEPYFYRRDPETETAYTLKVPSLLTLPWAPYPLHASASFTVNSQQGGANALAKVKFIDPTLGQSERPLAVGPPISVLLASPVIVAPTTGGGKSLVAVSVRSNVPDHVQAKLTLHLPKGWEVQPDSIPVTLDHDGDVNNYEFQVTPKDIHEGAYPLTARAEYNGKQYAEGFKVITRPDLDSYYSYHPATAKVEAVDVKLPPNLKVGYIMGAGDNIADVLKGVGLEVTQITPQELAHGDISQYGTIVVGIRAYDVRTDVREQNRRLLDYVQNGGTLIVQYNQSVGAFNEGHYTPYPATEANVRVSVEDQPVEILAPEERVFSWPNKISARDFDGWIQERGLYFMSQWDERFKPLLSSNDPGEPAQKGGLLLAHYGKGTYIFSGYAFSRQLPAGVPGAVRLFVNLVSAGR